MAILFPSMILISVLFGCLTGNMQAVSKAAIESAQDAVKIVLSLTGILCLWSGIMKISEMSSVTSGLTKIFSPFLRLLFGKKLPPKILTAIAMNLSANLLGLGNAATPLGIEVMTELEKIKTEPEDTASDEMILFTAMNSSSLQLIPTTVIGLRLACGSAAPMEILPAIWAVSLISFSASIFAAKLFSFCSGKE